MTIFHEDELDDTQVALSHRQSKKIPRWARSKFFFILFDHSLSIKFISLENQLELGIINQIYNDKNPEDIFGSIHLDLAHKMIDSIELWNTELPFVYSYSKLPPNFV
jgi:hypothetical protein